MWAGDFLCDDRIILRQAALRRKWAGRRGVVQLVFRGRHREWRRFSGGENAGVRDEPRATKRTIVVIGITKLLDSLRLLFVGRERNLYTSGRQQLVGPVLSFVMSTVLAEPLVQMFAGSGREFREE